MKSVRIFSTFGQLPGTWTNLAVIVLSGLAEGLGLVLFVPLLHLMMDGERDRLGAPFSMVVDGFELLGIPAVPITMLVAIGFLVLGSLGLGYLQRKMLAKAKQKYAWATRESLVNHLLGASWEHTSHRSHGEVVNQLVTECSRAGNALGYELTAVATAIQIVLYVVFSVVISWQLMLIAVGFGVIVAVVVRPLMNRAKELGEATNEANRNLSFYFVDYLRGLKLVKATANEDALKTRMASHNDAVFQVAYRSEINTAKIYHLVQVLPVVLLIGIIAIGHELMQLSPTFILVFLLFLARVAPRVAHFQQQHQSYLLAGPAIRVVQNMIETSAAHAEDLNLGGVDFETLAEKITLENVSYCYPDGDGPVVDDVSLTIGRNQMVAIVGSSGAGKSTLIDLIIGLRRPDGGHITVDGTDLADIDLVSWRSRIGLVTQDTVIFNDTLRNNLLLLSPGASDGQIDHALAIAHLNEVVASLPKGLNNDLEESGVRLSGGQKQRVALARALVGGPELLLLDEATSALDNESERYVQQALETIAHTMTIVVIAHRLSTVRRADVIHVMDKGRIVEAGTYDELLAKKGRFAELHESQFA